MPTPRSDDDTANDTADRDPMPTYTYDPDDEDDDSDADDSVAGEHLRSSELPGEADTDDGDSYDGDSDDTVPCPYCGKPVYYLGDVCPHCRSFVSLAAPARGHPRWVLVVALVLLGVVLFGWLIHGIAGL